MLNFKRKLLKNKIKAFHFEIILVQRKKSEVFYLSITNG